MLDKKFIFSFLGTIVFEIGLGSFFFLSNLNVYITSYVHLNQKWITMHYGNFLSTIMDFGSHLIGLLSGYIENKYGYKTAMIIGNIIIIFCSLGFFFQQNIFITYLLTFLFGCGNGICINVPIKNLCYYMPKQKGFINSIIGNILVLSAALYIFIGEKLINTEGYTLKKNDNFYPDHIAKRTPYYFLIVLFSVPILTFISLCLIYKFEPEEEYENQMKNKFQKFNSEILVEEDDDIENNSKDNINNIHNIKEKKNEKINENINGNIDKNENIKEDKNNNKKEEKKEEKYEEEEKIEKEGDENLISFKGRSKINYKKDLTPILKSKKFWLLIGILCTMNFLIKFILATFRTFGAIIGVNGSLFKYLSLCISITNIISGPIWGILIDKIQPKIIFIIMGSIVLFISISFQIFVENQFMFIILIILNVVCMGGFHSIVYPHVMEVFGMKYSIEINGIISIFSGFVGIIVSFLSFIVSLYYSNDVIKIPYKNIYLLGGFFDLFSIILSSQYDNEVFNYKNEDEKNNLVKKEKIPEIELELENL